MIQTMKESVARAICAARGNDPDQMVVPGAPYLVDGKQFAAVSEWNAPVPLWHFYVDGAVAAINAVSDWIKVKS